jgi:predicted double-glycine peptidase
VSRIAGKIAGVGAWLFVCLLSAASLAQAQPAARPHDKIVLQHWELSCGAAALATILTWQQGDPVTEREVVAGLLKNTSVARVNDRRGFSLLDLKRFAQDRGYRAVGYGELTIGDLAKLGPAIVPIRVPGGKHFVVFRGVHEDWVLVGDPARGTRLMRAAAFDHVWLDHEAFALSRADGSKPPDELAARPADFAASGGAGGSEAGAAGSVSGSDAGLDQP